MSQVIYNLTEITKCFNLPCSPSLYLRKWLIRDNTLSFIFQHEKTINKSFKQPKNISFFQKKEARHSSIKNLVSDFSLTCLTSKTGRNGATYADAIITMHYLSFISSEINYEVYKGTISAFKESVLDVYHEKAEKQIENRKQKKENEKDC